MRLLVVGSLAGELGAVAQVAIGLGARISQADGTTATIARLRSEPADAALCHTGFALDDLSHALVGAGILIPVIACGRGGSEQAARSIQAGARCFLPLPAGTTEVAEALDAACGASNGVTARDPVMLATVRRAEQLARAEASVLITGESGTGKEVLARHMHARSRRRTGPFVALNCAAIPDNLLESELFGHERGAFSGATTRRVGKFEAANGGTLLLDEIGEMDVRLQAKLLRAIQEREVDRVGGSAPVRVDVRILATTNRDMAAEIAGGRFRADLFFRLNVVAVRVPPLRERRADIEVLAPHFVRRYAAINGLPDRALTPDSLRRLLAYDWPGNVRELENVAHRAVLLAQGSAITPEAIELEDSATTARPAPPPESDPTEALVGRTVDEVERALILQTLQHTLGNRTHAATLLGISIRALRNKLRDYAAAGVAIPPPASGIAAPFEILSAA